MVQEVQERCSYKKETYENTQAGDINLSTGDGSPP